MSVYTTSLLIVPAFYLCLYLCFSAINHLLHNSGRPRKKASPKAQETREFGSFTKVTADTTRTGSKQTSFKPSQRDFHLSLALAPPPLPGQTGKRGKKVLQTILTCAHMETTHFEKGLPSVGCGFFGNIEYAQLFSQYLIFVHFGTPPY